MSEDAVRPMGDLGHFGAIPVIPDEFVCPNAHGPEGCILCSPCGGGQDTCDETLRYTCSRHIGRDAAAR